MPRSFDDLSDQDFVGIDNTEALIVGLAEQGLELRLEQFRARAASGNCMLQLIREGLGFGFLPLDTGGLFDDLVCVLPELFDPEIPGVACVSPGIAHQPTHPRCLRSLGGGTQDSDRNSRLALLEGDPSSRPATAGRRATQRTSLTGHFGTIRLRPQELQHGSIVRVGIVFMHDVRRVRDLYALAVNDQLLQPICQTPQKSRAVFACDQ
jgi:hypothetical protein